MITLGNLTGFVRRHIHDGCTGKKIFDSFDHARRQIRKLESKNAHRPELGELHPYTCHFCGRVHIGHAR